MTRHQTVLFRRALLVLDLVMSAVAFGLALLLRARLPSIAAGIPGLEWAARAFRGELWFDGYNRVLLGMLPLWALAFHYSKTADFRASYRRVAWRYLRGVGIGLGLLVGLSFWLKLTFVSRSFVFMFGGLQYGAVALGRLAAMGLIRRSKRVDDHCVLVVGTGVEALQFAQALVERSSWNNRFVGYLAVPGERESSEATPIVGKLSQISRILDTQVIDEVVFAVPGRSPEDFADALAACDERGVDVLLTVPSSVPSSGHIEIASVTGFNMPLLGLSRTPTGETRLMVKRVIDIVGSGIGIVLIMPLLLLVALLIKLEDGGPILFQQVRSGRNGRKFPMLKFRSMVVDAEKKLEELKHLNEMDGPVFKMKQDPRITRVGRFIRKTSIDELPQLFNVVAGHMSLVGPRPPLPAEVAQYEAWQRRRLSVRPGITGMWQVSGRNEIDFEQWMQLDLQYIDSWSLWLDVKILAKTVPVVLLHKGAS